MTLFIPRKQNMVSPMVAPQGTIAASYGPPIQPLGQYPAANPNLPVQGSTASQSFGVDPQHLEQVLRENFLAIQNYINRQVQAAALGSTAFTNVPGTSVFVGTATFKGYDYFNMNSTAGNYINLPSAGLWLCQAAWQVTNAGSGAIIGASFGDAASGATTPRHEHTYPIGPWSNDITLTEVIEWVPPTHLQGNLEVSALSTTTSPTQYRMTALTATKLGDIPSPTQ